MHVKWECNAKVSGMQCHGRHWEHIPHPFTEGMPVKLKPYQEQPVYTGGSYYGKCPRCNDENQVLHDFVHKSFAEPLKICVRCSTEMWQLSSPNSMNGTLGHVPYLGVTTAITDYMTDVLKIGPKVSELIPDPEKAPARVKGKIKCEFCGKFVERVYDYLNSWVCKTCREHLDEPDASIVEGLRKGME
jgi:phage FluMu protein Com